MNTTTGTLEYPFTDPPGPGEVRPVAPGVLWFRVPMPGRLNHINCWLIDEGDGWTVIDTGMPDEMSRAAWRQTFAGAMGGRPVKRVVVTHLHPDHVGLAGWLCDLYGVSLWMSRTDYVMCRMLAADTGRTAPPEAIGFYQAAGCSDQQIDYYKERFGGFGRAISPLPQAYHRIEAGDVLTLGGHAWHAIVGTGHAPEHICLHCPALNLFISGDQILPRISSNISVWPTEPAGNPLQDWLDSCARLKTIIPADVIVLPAHNDVFVGAHTRLDQLIEEHTQNLAKILELCRTPKRAVDLFSSIFKSQITEKTAVMATGEAVAHVSCLVYQGTLAREPDADGVNWYRTL